MRKLILPLVLLLGSGLVAQAQVNTVPSTGLTTGYLGKTTYSASSIGLVPAASATDVFCIAGSASKKIGVQKVAVSGTAGTLVSVPVTLLRRASVNTGGTAAATTALPVAAKHDSNAGTSAATLIAYTANPTIVDSAPVYFGSQYVTLPVTSAATSIVRGLFDFGAVSDLIQPLYVQGVAQQVCVNLNAVSVSSGLLNIYIMWTEE